MTRRATRLLSGLSLALGVFVLAASATSAAGEPEVVVLPTTGVVDQGMAHYLAESIARAERDGAAAVVIKLNTPGGYLTSTNDIVGTILEAKVPIIVWVAPAGGFAASAGTFITLAGNIAMMAPGTSIGAASPVSGQGEDIPGTLGDKVMNDAIAKITAIAEARGRNVEWAVSTVKDAKSSHASEAVAVGAVDGIAATIEEVLAFADGRQVEVAGQTVRPRSERRHGDRGPDEPVPGVHPPPVGPDDRLPAAQHRIGGSPRGAVQPELRHRHPWRPGADPRVHRPRGAPAQRWRSAAGHLRDRPDRARADRPQPRAPRIRRTRLLRPRRLGPVHGTRAIRSSRSRESPRR